ncbi:MAG TPA: cyclase family protein [Candidatus Baltobacteraceae bacterium]|nr:cyclase family protein [Candidatus Baltobacteraceae bacterium]
MKLIDITVPYHEGMAAFPGTAPPKFERIRRYEVDHKNIWSYCMNTVTGTHIEAPNHSIPDGATVDMIDLHKCYGPCEVREVKGKDGIIQFTEVQDIRAERVIFKTTNSEMIRQNTFFDDYVALSLEAAETLVANGVKLVGIDYYGIERRGSLDHPVHAALLKAGVVILVGVDLSFVQPGNYTLIAMPQRLQGLDGSPVRAVLAQE